jgi:macrolide transport system ATP-binding/permease protein
LIQVSDLKLSYRKSGFQDSEVEVLKGVTFHVRRGEKVAICGPSGSGKSTLLYILGGLLQPDSGAAQVAGNEVWEIDEYARARFRSRHIGFVFQSFHLIPGWTVLQNTLLGAEYIENANLEFQTTDRALVLRAQNILGKLGLAGLEDRLPNQLSGGQAQRVAIARALLLEPDLILADEPTGSLDEKTATEILAVLDEIRAEGKTVILITHDEKIAQTCDRIIRIQEGRVAEDFLQNSDCVLVKKTIERGPVPEIVPADLQVEAARVRPTQYNFIKDLAIHCDRTQSRSYKVISFASSVVHFLRQYSVMRSIEFLKRSPSRSLLTMIGVAVGVAAVVSMISIGRFAKDRILESYGSLGVRNFKLWGYPNWGLSISEPLEVFFRELKVKDIETVKNLFPEIETYSPVVRFWGPEISFLGKTVSHDLDMIGINEHGIRLNQFEIDVGRGLTALDVEDRNSVCIMGAGLARQLGVTRDLVKDSASRPLVFIKNRDLIFACRVVGLLRQKKSLGEGRWDKPGFEFFLPYSFLRSVRGDLPNSNEGDLNQVLFEVKEGIIPDRLAERVKSHFDRKYRAAGEFRAEANAKVIRQMRRFLDLFNILLVGIAFVTLAVGSSGVTNMILVSLSERIRELGIRRAVGADPRHLRELVLGESLTVCGLAGLIGMTVSLLVLHVALYLVSLAFPKIPFEWIVDPLAISVSLISILGVGFFSGLYPALRVEKLDVVSALRADG